ncbi:hypothetical protein LZG04_11180 [Saccharothrix sp. S26]|uniref:hypothetical protein n=1 Tax=Saccharothrix sp. S26 TaxID=2907215 RepID=UPI001F3E6AC1|nr:hypothetical protein [Saccharothrix sp. S26]MCE6995369.1 hypothetical protein [Saccharothrix sp. S26]
MLGRVTLAHLEFEAEIAAITGKPSDIIGHPLIKPTTGHALGKIGGLKFVDETGKNTTDEVRCSMDADEFDRRMAETNFRSPASEESPQVASCGRIVMRATRATGDPPSKLPALTCGGPVDHRSGWVGQMWHRPPRSTRSPSGDGRPGKKDPRDVHWSRASTGVEPGWPG